MDCLMRGNPGPADARPCTACLIFSICGRLVTCVLFALFCLDGVGPRAQERPPDGGGSEGHFII